MSQPLSNQKRKRARSWGNQASPLCSSRDHWQGTGTMDRCIWSIPYAYNFDLALSDMFGRTELETSPSHQVNQVPEHIALNALDAPGLEASGTLDEGTEAPAFATSSQELRGACQTWHQHSRGTFRCCGNTSYPAFRKWLSEKLLQVAMRIDTNK